MGDVRISRISKRQFLADLKMAIKVTTIRDAFKKKVSDVADEAAIKSYDAPTIWIDGRTGEEHEDFEYTHIESVNPDSDNWPGGPDDPFHVQKGAKMMIISKSAEPDILKVNGPIKQIGSHVIYCGRLYGNPEKVYPFLDNLYNVFKYARNLEYAFCLFDYVNTDGPLVVPENLFWNCTKLKEMSVIFRYTNLKNIPARLLERCTELEDVTTMFYNTPLKDIPEDLFRTNTKIKNFNSAFSKTNVKKVPDRLLEPFKAGIIDGTIDVSKLVEDTPLEKEVYKTINDKSLSQEEIDKKMSEYLPSYFPKQIQLEIVGYTTTDFYL